MNYYDEKKSIDYSQTRGNFTSTDEEVFTQLEKLGLKGKSILDYGCGDGRYALKFINEGSLNVIGVDTSPAMINLANQRLAKDNTENASFILVDDEVLPFSDNTFNIVFSNFVLHHIFDTKKALKEINRVLKIGGIFVATTSTYEIESGWDKLINTEIPICIGDKDDLIKVTNFIKSFEGLKKELEESQFKIMTYESITNPDSKIDNSYKYLEHIEKKTSFIIAKK